jgi:ubiquinone/menaquinone biosynthesis C-methylase UbiE
MTRHLHTHDIQQRYDGEVGEAHLASRFLMEHILRAGAMRRRIFGKAAGSILDVACGSGENFPHYGKGVTSITAIELSPKMLQHARGQAQKLGLKIDLRVMDAQQLEFPDDSFDTVVSAMATCTFPDPIAALREMQRVCKPGGRILLFEHGRSTWGVVARWQDRNAPQMYELAGCRFNQDPLQVVNAAGLHVISAQRSLAGVFHLIEIEA